MVLNSKKFEHISHKSVVNNKNLELFEALPFSLKHSCYFSSESIEISNSACVRDLGVFVDEGLNWKSHINTITKSCRQLCGWALSVFHTRNKVTMLTIFNSLIRPKLEYCCEIWHPHQIQEIRQIEQIQRMFTSRIAGMWDFNYWERLQKLELLSLQRRREKIIILHVWKILNGINPNTINMEFQFNSRFNSIDAKIKPLPKIRGKILTAFDNSFTIKAAKLWNVLPPKLTHITSLDLFKSQLDKFLKEVPDKPPLPGYPFNSDNHNSLINVCA